MDFYNEAFLLTNENIARVTELCVKEYELAAGYRKKSLLNLSLSVEELLLSFQSCFGENATCTVHGLKLFSSIKYKFECTGDTKNPLVDDVDIGDYCRRILERLGLKPSYHYRQRTRQNVVELPVPVKPSRNKTLFLTLGAVVFSLITFFILGMLPGSVSNIIANDIVNPVFTKITKIIAAIATPLVFLSVIDGISGLGNSQSIGSIGKRLIENMFLTYGIAAAAFSLLACLFYTVSNVGANGENILGELVRLVLDMIPNNLVECFATDNDLQVIIFAVFVGFVLVLMGPKNEKLLDGVSALSDLVNHMMAFVCRLLPVVVYLGILNMLLQDMSDVAKIYRVAIVFVMSSAVVIIWLLLRVKLVTKASWGKLFKKQLPTLLINLTTSSQVAALPENTRCCKEEFGIDERLVDFSLPLFIVTYMPCGACFIGLTAWSLAEVSGAPIDIMVILKIAVVSVVIAIAAPPIPGSAFAIFPVLFSSCGISLEYYSVAIILGTVLGTFLPALNGFCMQLDLLITAKQLKMTDPEKLQALK